MSGKEQENDKDPKGSSLISSLYCIELVLMEAQKKVFEKRFELQNQIKNAYNKGADTLVQVALTNSSLYKVPMVPSIPKEFPMKRTEIIDLEKVPPPRVPKIPQKTGRNANRKNQNNQQNETSINESEISQVEQKKKGLEIVQHSEIEIEMDIPNQIKQSLKDEKNLKKKKKKVQANCPVCAKLLSSRGSVKRHLNEVHKISQNQELDTIRFDKLSLQYNHETPQKDKIAKKNQRSQLTGSDIS